MTPFGAGSAGVLAVRALAELAWVAQQGEVFM
jgi:hypothetical protein